MGSSSSGGEGRGAECAYHHQRLEVGQSGEDLTPNWDVNPHHERWVWHYVVACTECEYEHTILGLARHTEPCEITEAEARALGFRSIFDSDEQKGSGDGHR